MTLLRRKGPSVLLGRDLCPCKHTTKFVKEIKWPDYRIGLCISGAISVQIFELLQSRKCGLSVYLYPNNSLPLLNRSSSSRIKPAFAHIQRKTEKVMNTLLH